MKLMEEVFFSFTFGGETLSLAAALTTLTKLQQEPVVKTLWEQGQKVKKGVNTQIRKHNLENVLSITGKDCWSFLIFKDTDVYSQWKLKTLFLQEVFARGVLTLGTHNMSYAHSDEDITRLLNVYNEVFELLKVIIENNVMDKWLKTKPLVPLFKIR
jgi:glutamate-1-semialdehyde 2,1-aminomutase